MTWAWIGVFGLCGVFARYVCGLALSLMRWGGFPLPTLVINLVGSFLAGVLFVLGTEKQWISPEIRIGLMVGFLGGFTTFSAYSLEAVRLLEEGAYAQALLYLVGSPALGALAAIVGIWLGRLWAA